MKNLLEYFSDRWGLFYAGVSAAILGAVYSFQFFLNHQPCELCYLQRYPYMIILVVAAIAYITRHRHDIGLKRSAQGFLIIIILLLVLEVFLAGHHIGVEQGLWTAYTSCAGPEINPNISNEEYLRFLMENPVVACDQRKTIFGISYPEYNLVISMLLTGFGLYTYNRTR